MARRRYVYRPNPETGEVESVEVGEDFQSTLGLSAPATDSYMDGVRATDGTDIGSRNKRRAYMKAHGLADADDFKGDWAKAAEKRADYRAGRSAEVRAQTREALGRALHQLQSNRKPR